MKQLWLQNGFLCIYMHIYEGMLHKRHTRVSLKSEGIANYKTMPQFYHIRQKQEKWLGLNMLFLLEWRRHLNQSVTVWGRCRCA